MPAGEGDELKAVAERRQLFAPSLHRRGVELGLPVEGRRAVIGKQLAREFGVDGGRKTPRFSHVGLGRLTPQKISVRRVGQSSVDGLLDAGLDVEKALARALTRKK